MAQHCFICGRGPRTNISRSHSMITTKRQQKLNLQTRKVSGKKIKICTKCLKTLRRTV